MGLSGGGGEYDVVVGFGWTNGVLLHFLDKYGGVLKYDVGGDGGGVGSINSLNRNAANVVFSSLVALLARRLLA